MASVSRIFAVVFALFSYIATLHTVYQVFWFLHPERRPLSSSAHTSALWQASLLMIAFGLQHSVMASNGWKKLWAGSAFAAAERSAYVLASVVVWSVESKRTRAVLKYLWYAGWLAAAVQALSLQHLRLFGLEQVVGSWRAPAPALQPRPASAQLPHPIFAPFCLVLWATGTMHLDRFLLALASSTYLLVRNDFQPDEYRSVTL